MHKNSVLSNATKIILATSILLLVGCRTSNPWTINSSPIPPVERVNFPKLGKVTTGQLGRTLAAWGVKSETPAIELLEDWEYRALVKGMTGTPAIFLKAGIGKHTSSATNLRTNEHWDCFSFDAYLLDHWNRRTDNFGTLPLCRNSEGRLESWAVIWDPKDKKARSFYGNFRERTLEELQGPTDVQEFVYNGRVGDALKFVYREFKNNYARPAYTQEVQYDLSQSEEIGFKDLKIKVIEASNTSITYIVTQNFGYVSF